MRPNRTRLTLAGILLTLVLAAVSGCDPANPDAAQGAPPPSHRRVRPPVRAKRSSRHENILSPGQHPAPRAPR